MNTPTPLPAATRRTEFLMGVRDELPILLGVLPFGLIYGVLARNAGLPLDAAMAISSIVFAGSSQFVGAPLLAANTPAVLVVLITLAINLRHMLYSASVAPYVRHLPFRWKAWLAYLLTDEAYAVAITRYINGSIPPARFAHWYFCGAGLALWSTWQLSSAIGLFLGTQIPEAWGLDFTLALTFIAIIVPALKDRATVGTALAAAACAVLAATLPHRTGILLAIAVGLAAGLVLEPRTPHTGAPTR